MDHVYAYLSYFGYLAGQATMDGFWKEMDRLGKGSKPVPRRLSAIRRRRRDPRRSLQTLREPAEYFYGRCLHVDPRFAAAPGYTSEATQRAGVVGQVAQVARMRRFDTLAREMDAIVEKGYVIIGSPDEVADRNCGRWRPISTSAT